MRKFILGLVALFLSFSLNVSAGPGGDAFPWGSEMPFPWKGIQGTWMTEIDGSEALVTFKVKRTQEGSRQLEIAIIDAKSCKVVASGLGFESGKLVVAMVSGGGRSSRVTVHAFRESDLRAAEGRREYKTNSMVAVMSVSPVIKGEKTGYELVKVSNEAKVVSCR